MDICANVRKLRDVVKEITAGQLCIAWERQVYIPCRFNGRLEPSRHGRIDRMSRDASPTVRHTDPCSARALEHAAVLATASRAGGSFLDNRREQSCGGSGAFCRGGGASWPDSLGGGWSHRSVFADASKSRDRRQVASSSGLAAHVLTFPIGVWRQRFGPRHCGSSHWLSGILYQSLSGT